MLFGVPADPLEDGSLQVVVDQEVLNWQLLRRQLRLPGQQRNEAHWPVHLGPPTCLRGLLEEVEKRLRVVLRPHLLQRHVGGQGWGWWNPPSPNLPVHPAPEQLAVLLLVLDEGTETTFLVLPHVQQRLVMRSANGELVGDDMMAAAFRLPSRVFGTTVVKVRVKERM